MSTHNYKESYFLFVVLRMLNSSIIQLAATVGSPGTELEFAL